MCPVCCSHFDAVTSVAFHPVEAMLLTGSEDKTLKLWNLQRNGQTRRLVKALGVGGHKLLFKF